MITRISMAVHYDPATKQAQSKSRSRNANAARDSPSAIWSISPSSHTGITGRSQSTPYSCTRWPPRHDRKGRFWREYSEAGRRFAADYAAKKLRHGRPNTKRPRIVPHSRRRYSRWSIMPPVFDATDEGHVPNEQRCRLSIANRARPTSNWPTSEVERIQRWQRKSDATINVYYRALRPGRRYVIAVTGEHVE